MATERQFFVEGLQIDTRDTPQEYFVESVQVNEETTAGGGGGFQPAWAANSNVILNAGAFGNA